MASRATISYLRSLHQKKFRLEENAFIVEGPKLVAELIHSRFRVKRIFFTPHWLAPAGLDSGILEEISPKELEQVSALHTPNKVLAVAEIPEQLPLATLPVSGLNLMIDQVQDPGNLGTILRIADWFGFGKIVCSPDTVELYNPKIVQSSMGSLFRMEVSYQSLAGLLAENAGSANLPVFAAELNGAPLSECQLSPQGWLIVGNESRGIQQVLKPFITQSVKIPGLSGSNWEQAESLNVAVATGIICYEFRRRFPL
jgi:TrmH family RNA methyltransferase